MTKFLDGPAAGVTLLLRRQPFYLRVVHDGSIWDALYQPTDKPHASETVYAYRLSGDRGSVHIRASGGWSGWYQMRDYRVIDPQPDDATLRSAALWEQWCKAEYARECDADERGPV